MQRTPLPKEQRASALARIQQLLVAMALGTLAVAAYLWQQGMSDWAVALTFAVLSAHAWVLAAECVVAAKLNRQDAAPLAKRRQWVVAWWREVRVAVRVFAWRQPFRWHALPDATTPGDAGKAAVVFVHGFVCNRGFWLPWLKELRESGSPYTTVNLEPVFGPIDDTVWLIEEAVARAEALGDELPSVICHSMGGLAVRAWLVASPQNKHRVRHIITIGTPHRGTWLARFSHMDNGRQMVPDGPWLKRLAAQEAAQRSHETYASFICWYSNTDNIVFPASTATLPGADNRLVQGAAHVDLAFHPRVMSESLAMLALASSSPAARTAS